MDPQTAWNKLRRALLARTVRFRRVAADSVILYIECEPGDDRGYTIWIDPPWHFCDRQSMLVGSAQTQGHNMEQGWPNEEELALITEPLNRVVGLPITGLDVDRQSRDLCVVMGEEYSLRTFANDATREHLWHIQDVIADLELIGSPAGLWIRGKYV